MEKKRIFSESALDLGSDGNVAQPLKLLHLLNLEKMQEKACLLHIPVEAALEFEEDSLQVSCHFAAPFEWSALRNTLPLLMEDVPFTINLFAVRSVPGRSFSTTRCRHPGCNETETLSHVLEFCRKTELLRNNRHHKARTGTADVLKRRGWEVHEEIHCVSSLDSNRRADIVAIRRSRSKGIVLDPIIRFERDAQQAQHVDEEKRSIHVSEAAPPSSVTLPRRLVQVFDRDVAWFKGDWPVSVEHLNTTAGSGVRPRCSVV
ncbi:hypothetical protein ANN_04754 [Periplaneta americana]|uniref:Reverse transcriptase n=1 Tax=Periplaneta americana TaxID=6978 RepID=A0ABQ8TAW4_PERAM|nr:hypothetical protein ANN_04754 [Periplaneta americana]